MNRRPEHDELLEAVLAESSPAGFRDALLADTLLRVRQRRRARNAIRAALATAGAVAIGMLLWRSAPPGTTPAPAAAGCTMVRTQPLPANARVNTQPFGAYRVVATFANVGIVRTRSGTGDLRVLTDDELLAIAAPRLPALVRTGPHTQELIFLAPTGPDARRMN